MTLFQAFGQFASSGAVDQGAMVFISSTPFTAASVVTLDGIFSSEYDNYRILTRFTYSTTLGDVSISMRSGGSSISGSNYDNQLLVSFSTSSATARQSNLVSARLITADDEGPSIAVIDVLSPALAEETMFLSQYGDGDGGRRNGVVVARHQLQTAYDGIQFAVGANNMTGRFDVYGLQKLL